MNIVRKGHTSKGPLRIALVHGNKLEFKLPPLEEVFSAQVISRRRLLEKTEWFLNLLKKIMSRRSSQWAIPKINVPSTLQSQFLWRQALTILNLFPSTNHAITVLKQSVHCKQRLNPSLLRDSTPRWQHSQITPTPTQTDHQTTQMMKFVNPKSPVATNTFWKVHSNYLRNQQINLKIKVNQASISKSWGK